MAGVVVQTAQNNASGKTIRVRESLKLYCIKLSRSSRKDETLSQGVTQIVYSVRVFGELEPLSPHMLLLRCIPVSVTLRWIATSTVSESTTSTTMQRE